MAWNSEAMELILKTIIESLCLKLAREHNQSVRFVYYAFMDFQKNR